MHTPLVCAPLQAVFGALPPTAARFKARTVLKRWLRKADFRTEVAAARDEPPWTPELDAQLLLAASTFATQLKKRTAQLKMCDLQNQFTMLKAGCTSEYVALHMQCSQLFRVSSARLKQRWALLLELNLQVEALLPYALTGCCLQPHTLGARLNVLRALIFRETKVASFSSPAYTCACLIAP